ncbi:MAG: hypothetical protein L3J65_04060 [Robiginitomaculum sp.]|nr:hypothetical protein [Robiginitomaculum sp.]
MKKYLSYIFIIALSALFLLGSKGIKQNPDTVLGFVQILKGNCTHGSLRCKIMNPIIRDAETITHGVNRLSVSKDQLPVVRIYMTDGAVGKLEAKRRSVLAMPVPIHFSKKSDWVKGTVVVEFDGRKEKSKVSLRLKGDWGDHLSHPTKISYRIKTRAGGYLFGMKTFSVQHPQTRAYGTGPLLLEHMRKQDILAPRQKFVDVYINDISIGIMSLEEHFAKEMIEAQNRRDGPLLALNEDPMWAQWNINFNTAPVDDPYRENLSGHRDVMIKDYTGKKFKRGSIPTNNQIRGQALLRDFLDGKASAGDSLDFDYFAKYWVLTNIWGGCHSAVWHNRRYYFNPISGLLEPVSFDNMAFPNKFAMCVDADVQAAFGDADFRAAVNQEAEVIRTELQTPAFAKWLSERQILHRKFFSFEHFEQLPGQITPELLLKNLEGLLAELDAQLTSEAGIKTQYMYAEHGFYGGAEDGFVRTKPGIIDENFLREQAILSTHLTAFYYAGEDSGTFEFRNLTLADIDLKSIYVEGKNKYVRAVDFTPFVLESAKENPRPVAQSVHVPDTDLSKYKSFKLDYIYKGKPYTRAVDIQYKNTVTGFVADPVSAIRTIVGAANINEANKQVTFTAGIYDINKSIALPKNWGATMQAGARLNFNKGSLLKISGPLIVDGTKDMPVNITLSSNTDYFGMGAWGGIFVSKSATRSRVNHLQLTGTSTQNLANRQGYYGMTGCMSFYESDVDITNSRFIDAQCEDALNIVKSDFNLTNILIKGARADAFDTDFSVGIITSSSFTASGNDGIDISGTALTLDNITMSQIGDKAVSVGEKSTLEAKNIRIDGAVLGVVSKDLSRVNIADVSFANISGTALMTYIKKQEYGPSQINCENCTFKTKMIETGQQESTQITLNQTIMTQTKLSRKQMVSAGLLIEGAVQ